MVDSAKRKGSYYDDNSRNVLDLADDVGLASRVYRRAGPDFQPVCETELWSQQRRVITYQRVGDSFAVIKEGTQEAVDTFGKMMQATASFCRR
jgi:hypothetical protein